MAFGGENNLPRLFHEVSAIRAKSARVLQCRGGRLFAILLYTGGPKASNNFIQVVTHHSYRCPSQRVFCFLLFSDLFLSLQLVCALCLPLPMRMATKMHSFGATACCVRILLASSPLHQYLFKNFIKKKVVRDVDEGDSFRHLMGPLRLYDLSIRNSKICFHFWFFVQTTSSVIRLSNLLITDKKLCWISVYGCESCSR